MRAELAVVHDLEERMLLRRRDEPGAALEIFPQSDYVTLEALTCGSGLERCIGLASLLRCSGVERGTGKHRDDGGPPDIQIGDRNRTI